MLTRTKTALAGAALLMGLAAPAAAGEGSVDSDNFGPRYSYPYSYYGPAPGGYAYSAPGYAYSAPGYVYGAPGPVFGGPRVVVEEDVNTGYYAPAWRRPGIGIGIGIE
jgi:hypothetical protein